MIVEEREKAVVGGAALCFVQADEASVGSCILEQGLVLAKKAKGEHSRGLAYFGEVGAQIGRGNRRAAGIAIFLTIGDEDATYLEEPVFVGEIRVVGDQIG